MAQCIDCGVPVTSGLVIHKECYETLKKAVQRIFLKGAI